MTLYNVQSCRQQTLKILDSRPALIAICTLVVIECVCVLVELMVDLQGIKFRFENEENEIQRFVDYIKKTYPAESKSFEGRTMEDIISKLQENLRLKNLDDFSCSPCKCNCDSPVNTTSAKDYNHHHVNYPKVSTNIAHNSTGSSSSDASVTSSSAGLTSSAPETNSMGSVILTTRSFHEKGTVGNSSDMTADNKGILQPNSIQMSVNSSMENGTESSDNNATKCLDLSRLFVLEINNVKESFFLVAEYYPEHVAQDTTKHKHYHSEYDRIHLASTGIHLGSLAILSIMVIETFIKLFCVGVRFFKKRFEVFDAFIVLASFALDFIFLDSRWYETGKDATTILVLLLPWRVVRIVNSFLMTVNHKHHIEMMTIKRAKKKSEVKNAKLNTLLAEIRHDVQLLMALCKSNNIPEIEISACVYGKGRHNATIAAMSSFASLMLISTLGKNAVHEDDIYGKLLREALEDDDEDENGNDVKEDEDESNQLEAKPSKKTDSKKKKKDKSWLWRRSHTLPRRSQSVDNVETPENADSVENGNVFYVNDGYLTAASKDGRKLSGAEARRASFHSKASVRSIPGMRRGRNYVTFELTTQVTYL